MDNPATQSMPANDSPAQSNARPVQVLCVEDEHFIGELYARALTKAGYQVTNVVDGVVGLKEAQSDKYDIILLDIMIPNLTGTEILKTLRDPVKTPKLHSKIIMTTNLEQSDDGRDEGRPEEDHPGAHPIRKRRNHHQREGRAQLKRRGDGARGGRRQPPLALDDGKDGRIGHAHHRSAGTGRADPGEIGRASCRERG